MRDPTVEEAYQARLKLEDDILRLIKDFEHRTTLTVATVLLKQTALAEIRSSEPKLFTFGVKVEARL